MIWRVLIALSIFSLASCAMGRRTAESIKDVREDEVVLVGSVILEPALRAAEKDLRGGDRSNNKALIKVDPVKTNLLETIGLSDLDHLMIEDWGKVFYIPVHRSEKIFVNGIYTYVSNGGQADTLIFPIRGMIHVPINQKYLYIGTIHIRRTDYSEYKGIKITDDFAQAIPAMKKKFPDEKLHKSMLSILLD